MDYYGVREWGSFYFLINQNSLHLSVNDRWAKTRKPLINFMDIINTAVKNGARYPFLLRIPQLIQAQMRWLYRVWYRAIIENDYPGIYTLAYPIKVNQFEEVIETIINTRLDNIFERDEDYYEKFKKILRKHGIEKPPLGLEVGSKAEMLIPLAKKPDYVVCNGFMDKSIMKMAMFYSMTGRDVFIVMNEYSNVKIACDAWIELKDEIKEKIGKPLEDYVKNLYYGIRIKPHVESTGHWGKVEGTKFGLRYFEMADMIDEFRKTGIPVNKIRMLHFHIGSQQTDILPICRAVEEFIALAEVLDKEGTKIEWFNFGGGAAIDYTCDPNDKAYFRRYNMPIFASEIVSLLADAKVNVNLITESGRYIVAHYLVLVTNVLARIHDLRKRKYENSSTDSLILEFQRSLKNGQFSRAWRIRNKIIRDFILRKRKLSLRELAWLEYEFLKYCTRAGHVDVFQSESPPKPFTLPEFPKSVILANLSSFSSVVDNVLVGNPFPIVPLPISRKPEYSVEIADITCDTDGVIRHSQFGTENIRLPYEWKDENGEELIAIFLLGAYQEILRIYHNLFGDMDIATVKIRNSSISVSVRKGQSVSDILHHVEYDPTMIYSIEINDANLRKLAEDFLTKYKNEYTYLNL